MQVLSRSYRVAHGCQPELFDVTFRVGDAKRVLVSGRGHSRELAFNGKGYRPGSHKHLVQAVEAFLGILAREVEAEAREQRIIAGRIRGRVNQHGDRQLPVADRA